MSVCERSSGCGRCIASCCGDPELWSSRGLWEHSHFHWDRVCQGFLFAVGRFSIRLPHQIVFTLILNSFFLNLFSDRLLSLFGLVCSYYLFTLISGYSRCDLLHNLPSLRFTKTKMKTINNRRVTKRWKFRKFPGLTSTFNK